MRIIAFFGAGLLLFSSNCRNQAAGSPVDAAQQWQSYIDRNQFELARQLSTDQAKTYVDFLDALTDNDDTSFVDQTILFNLQCEVHGDSAYCRYMTEDEIGEKIPGMLILKKWKNRWLVDKVEGFELLQLDSLQKGEENLVFPPDSLDEEYQ